MGPIMDLNISIADCGHLFNPDKISMSGTAATNHSKAVFGQSNNRQIRTDTAFFI